MKIAKLIESIENVYIKMNDLTSFSDNFRVSAHMHINANLIYNNRKRRERIC